MTPSEETIRYLALASDFEAVRVFEAFAKSVAEAIVTPREELLSSLPENLRSVDGSEVLPDIELRADESLSPGVSVQSARTLLTLAAGEPGLAPLVKSCFESWQDERQLVDVVLEVGLVGAVWMVLASTRVVLKVGPLKLEKSANGPEQLTAFADIIRAIRGTRHSGVAQAEPPAKSRRAHLPAAG